jgi:ubiquinone/menaquinone biosynthesis C-methylase UbiE
MADRLSAESRPGAFGSEMEVAPYRVVLGQEIIARMEIESRDRILDVGCGEGWAGRFLAAGVPQGIVVGLDISDAMIHQARVQSATAQNLMFVWGDAGAIPWQENFFSKVFCIDSLDYFEDPEKALREIFRVMSPLGSLWIWNLHSKENERSLRPIQDLDEPAGRLSSADYERLLERCGFEDCRFETIRRPIPLPEGFKTRPSSPDEVQRLSEVGVLMIQAKKPEK